MMNLTDLKQQIKDGTSLDLIEEVTSKMFAVDDGINVSVSQWRQNLAQEAILAVIDYLIQEGNENDN